MEKLGLNEIRKRFKEFYISKEHYAEKSASLIPKNDKSLLIINSGMAPLKAYFAGLETPPKKRMTTCQKCIRTGDIDNVGITSRHGTFFEMLGNFSFGDYFKKESLTWGVEFMTEVLGMPFDKIWATVYDGDEEAIEIWKSLGMPEDRIVPLGKDDNFWEIGLGPCGPCSELYFDRGEEFGCGSPDCKPGCECDRYLEFWNHVFTQFSKEEDGSYSKLAHPNIDTGMGLERMACIMQGVDSIFDIDTIRYILNGVVEKSGIEYKDGQLKTDVSIRIITDHLRSITFMIADGIMPSNEGRGYVLRRLLRRAARHGRMLGIQGNFLVDLSNRVIEVSHEAYPELMEKKEYIQKIIQVEEENFQATIGKGEEIINSYIAALKSKGSNILKGENAFKLYDTYGFPIELTQEILADEGFSVDLDGFKAHMQKQKELARSNRKNTEDEAWKDSKIKLDIENTKFIGYEKLYSQSKVLGIINKDGIVDIAKSGEEVLVILDKTPFYPEGGGQVSDNGFMSTTVDVNSEEEIFFGEVKKVEKKDGIIYHTVLVQQGELKVGYEVLANVESKKRFATMRNHTATHLLHKALREVLGNHVEQAGSLVNENILRFDFSHFEAVSREALKEVEELVNEQISQFLPVKISEMTLAEAQEAGAMALFGEKYGENVRVVQAGDWSIELCGGTHVNNIGEIGAFKILSEGGISSGIRRIEATTGMGVYRDAVKYENIIIKEAEALKCNKTVVLDKVLSNIDEIKVLKKEVEEFKQQAIGSVATDILGEAKTFNDIKLITKEFQDFTIDDLRNLSDDLKSENSDLVLVFATVSDSKVTFLVSISDELVEKGLHAGKMIKEIAKACGGGGGGKANMAQAGAKDPSKIKNAFEVAENLLK